MALLRSRKPGQQNQWYHPAVYSLDISFYNLSRIINICAPPPLRDRTPKLLIYDKVHSSQCDTPCITVLIRLPASTDVEMSF